MQDPRNKFFLLMKGTFIEGKLRIIAIAFGSYQDYSRYSTLKFLGDKFIKGHNINFGNKWRIYVFDFLELSF